jgi:hypothetical protein
LEGERYDDVAAESELRTLGARQNGVVRFNAVVTDFRADDPSLQIGGVELDIAEHVLVAPASPLFRVYNNGRPNLELFPEAHTESNMPVLL